MIDSEPCPHGWPAGMSCSACLSEDWKKSPPMDTPRVNALDFGDQSIFINGDGYGQLWALARQLESELQIARRMTDRKCYEYPLRWPPHAFTAQVVIPRDLNNEEAARLCAFIMTIAQPTMRSPCDHRWLDASRPEPAKWTCRCGTVKYRSREDAVDD